MLMELEFAVFDLVKVRGIAPGLDCHNWYSLIEAHYYRIKGRSHLRNWLYTADNVNNFYFCTNT